MGASAVISSSLYGNAQPQTAAKIHAYGGRGPQTPPKTKQEKVTEIHTEFTSKSVTKGDGTLKRTGKYNSSIFLNLHHPNAQKSKIIRFST